MTNRARRSTPNIQQAELGLDIPEHDGNAPDLDIQFEQRGAIAHAIKHAKRRGWGREQIIDRMNLCLPDLPKKLTLRQLNAWTADSKEFSEFPARFIPAFCWATHCWLPIETGPHSLGFVLADRDDAEALELGRLQLAEADIRNRKRAIQRRG